jgi:gliding motility-associated-like protein
LSKTTLTKFLSLLFIITAFNTGLKAATYYWVDGAGSWNDASHWATYSGGNGGTGVPGINDDAVFDKNSFHVPYQVVDINASASCHNMTWTNDVYSPILDGNSSLTISGSLAFSGNMQISFSGTINFKSSVNGNVITSSAQPLKCEVYFNGTGSWQLNGPLYIPSSTLALTSGTLHAYSNLIKCATLKFMGPASKVLDINNSIISINTAIDSAGASNFAIQANKGAIYFKNFSGVKSLHTLAVNATTPHITAVVYDTTVATVPSCSCLDTLGSFGAAKCCNGKVVIFNVTSSNGGTPFTYVWSTGHTNRGVSRDSVINICDKTTVTVQVTDTIDGGNIFLSWTLNGPKLNVLSKEIPKVPRCFGDCNGWIIGQINGGTPNFTYTWSSGKPGTGTVGANTNFIDSALCGNATYTVTVVDANKCRNTHSYFIGQPAAVNCSITSTNLSCNAACIGTATATGSGGHVGTTYTYKWAPGGQTSSAISALCAGTYTCTVKDDSGCSGTASVTISQPPPLAVTLSSQTNEPCFGNSLGSACINVSGGTPAYTYKWSNGQTSSCATNLSAGTYSVLVTDANGCKDSLKAITITQPPALTATITNIVNIKCNSGATGSITVTAGGGTPGYTYSWSPSGLTSSTATGLTAGCYTVTVTDANGCNVTASACISQPAAIRDSLVSLTNVKCFGGKTGSITIGIKGGTPAYTYLWSPGGETTDPATNLGAGTYTLTITDKNGCTATISATITQPTQLTATITSQVNVDCHGNNTGSATVTAGGGTPLYTYSWAPSGKTTSSITGLTAGCYTVTVTDANACTATASVCITQPANPLKVTLTASPNPLPCFASCISTITSTVSGGTSPYNYLWSPGGQTSANLTNQCAGTYKLVVTDAHGCKDSASITISQPPQLRDSITSVTNVKCNGGSNGSASVGVKGGTPAYTYNWSPGGATGTMATGLSAGTYTVTVTDKNGCTATASVTITQPPPLNLVMGFKGELCSGNSNGEAYVTVSGGTPGYTYTWTPGGGTLDTIKNLAVGCYTVTVKDKNGCSATGSVCITEPNPLTAVISSTLSTCGKCDGSAKVTAGGGTAPYTYLWTPTGQTVDSATGLCVGNYTVTVTDADGCTATAKVTIVPTVKIVITTSGSTVSCDSSCDGIASANPSGGLSPYSYLWAPGGQTGSNATGLCAGSYTVTVTDKNGCSSIDSVTILNPPKLIVTTSQSNVTCVGKCNGSATATASGGTPGYTYSWSPGGQTTSSISGLCIGTYTIMVTDANGCKDSAVVNITSGGSIFDNATLVNPSCNKSNGSISLAPSGGTSPYTYLWSPGGQTTSSITGLSAGTYTVVITDNSGCNQTFLVPLSNSTGPTVTATNTGASCADTCDGSVTATVTAGVGPYTYSWSNGATTSTVTALCPGVYACNITDANGCITAITDTVKKPVPISPNATVKDINCNTGASTGQITLATTGGTGPYTYTWAPGGQTTSVITGLSAGSYTVTIKDKVGCDTVVTISVTEPPVLNVIITSTNITCNGANNGTATANVSGGTPPYVYSWSNGAVTPTDVNLTQGTYTVTVMDANGCQVTASITITQPPPLTDVMKTINVSCNLGSNGGGVSTVSGGTPPYTYNWSNGQTTDSLQNVSQGTYYLTITDANGCTLTDSVKVIAPPPLVVTFTQQNDFCNAECNGTATANVSGGTPGYTYSWNTIPVQTNQTATGLCAGSYIVTVTDKNGCVITGTVIITQPTAINANVTATPTSCSKACDGTATSTPFGGTAPYTYKWSTGQTTSTVTGLCPGTDTVFVTDKNGCIDTGIINIPKPTPLSITASTAAANCGVCNGSMTAFPSGGTGPYTYLWSPGGQTTSSVTGECAGLYTVQVTDSKGCDSSFTVLLNNTGGPNSFNNTVVNELCFGDTNGTIVAIPNGGTLPYTYLWTAVLVNDGQGTDSIYTLSAGTYTLQVTDNVGCIQFDTVSVIQPPQLTATAAITNAACTGVCTGSISLTASGGTPPYTYDWSNSSTTALITGLCPGSYSDTITDKDGCSIVQTYVVGTNTGVSATTNVINNILCNGSNTGSATVNASGGGGTYTYAWAPGAQTTQSITGLSAGTYTVTVKDQNGCLDVDSAIITQPAALTIAMKVTPITCNNSCDGEIIANISGGVAPYKNHWSNGSKADTLSALCSGKFTDTVTDANGCVAIDSVTLVNPPVFNETHIVTNSTCNTTPDGSINLTVTGGIPPYTYSWAPPVSTTSNATGLTAGTYTVTIKDSTGCIIIDSIAVPADTTVLANAGNDTTICNGAVTITLNGSKSVNAVTYQWLQLPGMTLLGTNPIITIPAPGSTTTYELVVTDGTCTDTAKMTVTISPPPAVDAGPTQTIFIYFSCTIGGSPTGPAGSTYHWSPAKGLSDTTAANPVASPTVTTTYTVTVTTPGGCVVTDTVTVFVLPQVVIPSGFTPNGDGQNDVWNIRNIDQFPNAVVELFNRWGEELFRSVGYKTPWDGTYDNKPLPVGTYYYIIDLHDPRFPKAYTGPVTIMR